MQGIDEIVQQVLRESARECWKCGRPIAHDEFYQGMGSTAQHVECPGARTKAQTA